MSVISVEQAIETTEMFSREHLDVRTITMGISLLDTMSSSVDSLCKNIEKKILYYASNLVKVANDISEEYGIPIVNKRISITPMSIITESCCKKDEDYIKVAKTIDGLAKKLKVDFIGGWSAIVSGGLTENDKRFLKAIPKVLSKTKVLCSSVVVGSTKAGLDMDAVKLCGKIIKETARLTKNNNSIGCAKFVVFANSTDDNPFMAGAFHGISQGEVVLNVGVSGPGVVRNALLSAKNQDFTALCETIKKIAFKITRIGQFVGTEASKRLNIPLGIIDLSLAPTPAMGDSVADVLELIGLESVGAPGTTAALALLNEQVKKGGIMAARNVGGLSGAFIPVSEDQGMINAVLKKALTIEKLEAMTCVCSVGLDMIAIPGDTSEETISGIIADEMMIGIINQKTTAVRVIPAYGKKAGDKVSFGGLLGYAPIMKVNEFSCKDFINRGGHIPAPVHSFKN